MNTLNKDVVGELDILFEEALEGEIPGLAAGVVMGRDLVWSKGYGLADVDSGRVVTPDTIFRIGSLTKLFTATMLMQLVEAGKIELDDPVPLLAGLSETPITYLHLATHMSGLPRMPRLPAFSNPFAMLSADLKGEMRYPSVAELEASLADTPLDFEPGTKSEYSNLGVGVLGNALATVAGQPYREYVTEHILRPLGTASSGFNTEAVRDRMATGYIGAGYAQMLPELEGKLPMVAPVPDLMALAPAGQLYSTIHDLAHFTRLQFTGGSVLSTPMLDIMHQSANNQPPIGWHVQDAINNEYLIGHGGGDYGYTAYLLIAPDAHIGLAICTNAGMAYEVMSTLPHFAMELLLSA